MINYPNRNGAETDPGTDPREDYDFYHRLFSPWA